ncbi:major facilitator superfamily domain-containing protein [Bombardia bombarda]|uniref:Major facilitator superfamily domain-containing protein n=1 Tax=Bombardia bombarda TaxID=252184 RepID=A0AA39X0R0_9PEZI|nr:major facilitator superfamily domain-containing protein [Bombardia bombarda]
MVAIPKLAGAHLPETSLWKNRKCLLICAVVATANMQYGVDSTVMASLQAMPGFLAVFGHPDPKVAGGYGIDRTFQQLIGSLLTLGAFLSSIFAGAFAHFFGRRQGLWVACFLAVLGSAIQIGTTDKGVVYFGRLIIGIGNGFLVTFSNIYCAEAAPAHLRAVMVALFSEWVNIGSVLGAVICNQTQIRLDKSSYQIPLGVQFIVPVLLAIGLVFVPESPRYLLNKGKEEQARRSFKMLRGRSDLRRTLLCFGVIATQTGSGSWFLISYSTYFMVVSGLTVSDAFKYSIMKTCLGFIGVNVGMVLMRHFLGRRSVMMIGSATQGLCQLAMAISATVAPGTLAARNCLIAFTALYMFCYNAFVGDASYPVATEVVSTRLRSWTVGAAISLGYFLAWLTGFCSPYFINPDAMNWGAKYAYIWAGSNFICGIFFFLFLPELKGRTLEEIDELFERGASAWKFKSTKTNIMNEALREVQEKEGHLIDSKAPVELVDSASTEKVASKEE